MTFNSLLAGTIGGLLVMVVKTWYDARAERWQRKRRLKAMLVLIDVEISLNEQAAALYSLNPTGVAVSIRESLRVGAWKDTRIRIGELMNDIGHYDKLAHYYEDVELARDLLYRSDLPKDDPKRLAAELRNLRNRSEEIRRIIKMYTNITEPSWWHLWR